MCVRVVYIHTHTHTRGHMPTPYLHGHKIDRPRNAQLDTPKTNGGVEDMTRRK